MWCVWLFFILCKTLHTHTKMVDDTATKVLQTKLLPTSKIDLKTGCCKDTNDWVLNGNGTCFSNGYGVQKGIALHWGCYFKTMAEAEKFAAAGGGTTQPVAAGVTKVMTVRK